MGKQRSRTQVPIKSSVMMVFYNNKYMQVNELEASPKNQDFAPLTSKLSIIIQPVSWL